MVTKADFTVLVISLYLLWQIEEIDDRYKAGQTHLPLHLRPSPKLKTPDIHDDYDDVPVDKSVMSLQRKPRGPPVSKTPNQEVTTVI